jgi:DNA-binding winged helix-turn-helix (wHTH) protein/tetratricopeptide (TPR) repeat protein/TolB-like protein
VRSRHLPLVVEHSSGDPERSLPFVWQFSGRLIAVWDGRVNCVAELDNPVYRFGGFELDPAERRLSAAGKPVALTPKVFDTLVLLVERAGRLVSKDELMRALWPRGYVEESNLTKHIWVIRRALGDGEQGSRFIETVPKLGYRFVATVTTVEHVAPAVPEGTAFPPQTTAAEPVVLSPPSRMNVATTYSRQRTAWLAIGVAGLTLALASVWLWWPTPRMTIRPAETGSRTIAIMGFGNLSQNPKDAWLGPALTAMISTELTVSERLRMIPEELVRDARRGVEASGTGGYGPDALERLRARLDADYLVTGTYLVAGSEDEAPLRIDMTIQDAHSGTIVASISRLEHASSLLSMVGQAGVVLRSKLGIPTATAESMTLAGNAEPPSADVARRFGFALDALDHNDAERARDELLEVVSQAPGYAPAYRELARAWSLLGYRQKAAAAAEQAASHAAGLPPDQRLQVEAVVAAMRYDWKLAGERWAALVAARPNVPEFRFQLIDALIASGNIAAAQTALPALRALPSVANDARVDLAAARVAGARADVKTEAEDASAALRKARQRESPGLIADALFQLATAHWHTGRNEEARNESAAAIEAYRAIGNPRGEARARSVLGAVYADTNHRQEAREAYQQAMAQYRSIGDVGGVGGVYRDLSEMLWTAGDRDGAQVAARQGLSISREIGDLPLEAWTTRALATIESDEAATDAVVDGYRRVVELNERTGDHGGRVWSLATLADTERVRGELDEAHRDCERAEAEAATLSDPQFAVYSRFTCALVAVDRGETVNAIAALERIERAPPNPATTIYEPNAAMMLAQLAMDRGRYADARAGLEHARGGFAAAEATTGEADVEAMLALCDEALGMPKERDAALARARDLRRSITSRQEVYVVDIALATVGSGSRSHAESIVALEELSADAERRHWLAWSLESSLAAWRLARESRDAPRTARLHERIESEARKHGFGRILALLGPAAASPTP